MENDTHITSTPKKKKNCTSENKEMPNSKNFCPTVIKKKEYHPSVAIEKAPLATSLYIQEGKPCIFSIFFRPINQKMSLFVHVCTHRETGNYVLTPFNSITSL